MNEESKHNEMSFFDHLNELRKILIYSLIFFIIAAIGVFIAKSFVFDVILLGPQSPSFITNKFFCKIATYLNTPALCINKTPILLQNIKISGQFAMHISASVVGGIIISAPFIIYQLWKFIKPALYETEQKQARGAVFYISALFFIGVSFGYFIICPVTFNFFNTYSVSTHIVNQINIESYISQLLSLVLASGITFEVPVVIYFLTKIGMVTPSFLKKYRRHTIVIILIIAAIITPPDAFSQLLVAIPLYLLFELSIIISKRVEKISKGT